MPRSAEADFAVDALIEMGVLSEAGLKSLGQLLRGVQALRGGEILTRRRHPS